MDPDCRGFVATIHNIGTRTGPTIFENRPDTDRPRSCWRQHPQTLEKRVVLAAHPNGTLEDIPFRDELNPGPATQGSRCAANPGLFKNVPSGHGWNHCCVREDGGKSVDTVVIDGALRPRDG